MRRGNRIISLLLACLMVFSLSSFALAAPQYELGSYKVTSVGGIKMYENNTSSSSQLTVVRCDTILTVTQINSGYGFVRYDGFTGWVSLSKGLEFYTAQPHIVNNKIDGAVAIKIKALPTKLSYVDGEEYADTTGLVLGVEFDDGSELEMSNGFVARFPSLTGPGKKTVTIYVGELSCTYEITVLAVPVSRIVISLPEKTIFTVGDPIDFTGLQVRAFYADGRDKGKGILLDKDDYKISGVREGQTDLKAGTYDVKIMYKYPNITASFTILVKEIVISSIKIIALPDTVRIYQGQSFDKNNFRIQATTSDGRTMEVKDFTLSYDNKTVGTHTATITYGGKKAVFSYDVMKLVQTGIELDTGMGLGSNTGKSINLSNLTVYAKYNSGERKKVTNYTQTNNININKAGTYTVTVKHGGFTATAKYKVKNENITLAGDVDGNGKIEAKDARMTLRFSARLEKYTDDQKLIADVDSNGKIEAKDARKILRVSAKLESF